MSARESCEGCVLRHATELRAKGHPVRVWMVALASGYPMYVVRRVLAAAAESLREGEA